MLIKYKENKPVFENDKSGFQSMNVIYDTDNLQVYVIAVHGQTFQMMTLKLCPDLLRQK